MFLPGYSGETVYVLESCTLASNTNEHVGSNFYAFFLTGDF